MAFHSFLLYFRWSFILVYSLLNLHTNLKSEIQLKFGQLLQQLQIMNSNIGGGVKNVSRIQKALQQLEKLTPLQIESLNSQQSLNQLRLKRLQFLKSQVGNNQGKPQNAGNQQAIRGQIGQRSSIQMAQWSIFSQVPVIVNREKQRNYEEQFNQKINEYRKKIRIQEEEKYKKQKQLAQNKLNQQGNNKPNNNIFSVVFNNQTGPFGVGSKKEKQPLTFNLKPVENMPNQSMQTQKSKELTEHQKPSIFNNFTTNKNPIFEVSNTDKPAANQGFVPGLINQTKNNIDIFSKKLQVPQVMPHKPLESKSGLFSQQNPISHIKPNTTNFSIPNIPASNLFSNNSVQNNPKPNIFQKSIEVPLPEHVPIHITGGLFSNNNPWTENQPKSQGNALFTNNNLQKSPEKNTVQQKQSANKQQKSIVPQQKPKKESESIFSNKNPNPNLFGPSTSIFGNNLSTLNTIKPSEKQNNEQLFKNATFSNKPVTSLSSLFTSQSKVPDTTVKLGQQILEAKNQNVQQKKQEFKPKAPENIFSNLLSKPLGETSQPKNFFSNLGHSSSIFSHNKQQPKQEQSQSKSPFGINLVPIQTTNQQFQQNQSQKKPEIQSINKPKKKANQLFSDFAKSKPENMLFSKDNNSNSNSNSNSNTHGIFGKPAESTNIFGGKGSFFGGGNTQNIFGNSLISSDNIFAKKQEPSKKQDDDEQGDEEGDDDEAIQHKQEIDPSKSTGNYKYEQSKVIYRQTVPKFKKGNQNIIQNVIITIQKFTGNQNYTLSVRFANKCHYFSGTIQAGFTEIMKIKETEFRNISIKKMVVVGEDQKPSLESLKIQFKDEKQGSIFYEKFISASKK